VVEWKTALCQSTAVRWLAGWLHYSAPLRDIHINIECYILMEVEHDSLLFRKNADDTKMDKKRPCPLRPLHIRRFQADSTHINHSISKVSSEFVNNTFACACAVHAKAIISH
jgi:hypothetical protein